MTQTTEPATPRTVPRDALLELFLLNRSVPDADGYARILQIERDWIVPKAAEFEGCAYGLNDRSDVIRALRERLDWEEANPPDNDRFVAEEATREQFAAVVAEFAIDGLTEAQSFLPILQRLPHRCQMAVLRVLIDEFGCGNVEQSHSQLYRNLLSEFDLSIDVADYHRTASRELLEFVNLFYWLSARAPKPDYFLGALAYFEASILYGFRSFAAACERLGVRNGKYYTEHLHIDTFHKKEMQLAIKELDVVQPIDPRKVWAGVELAGSAMAGALDAAVAKAKAVA